MLFRSDAAPGRSRDATRDGGSQVRRPGPFSGPCAGHAGRRLQRTRPEPRRSPSRREKLPQARPGSVLPERQSVRTSSCEPKQKFEGVLKPVIGAEPHDVQIIIEAERRVGRARVVTELQAGKVQAGSWKIDVEIFGFHRPVPAKRVFDTAADGPTHRS